MSELEKARARRQARRLNLMGNGNNGASTNNLAQSTSFTEQGCELANASSDLVVMELASSAPEPLSHRLSGVASELDQVAAMMERELAARAPPVPEAEPPISGQESAAMRAVLAARGRVQQSRPQPLLLSRTAAPSTGVVSTPVMKMTPGSSELPLRTHAASETAEDMPPPPPTSSPPPDINPVPVAASPAERFRCDECEEVRNACFILCFRPLEPLAQYPYFSTLVCHDAHHRQLLLSPQGFRLRSTLLRHIKTCHAEGGVAAGGLSEPPVSAPAVAPPLTAEQGGSTSALKVRTAFARQILCIMLLIVAGCASVQLL